VAAQPSTCKADRPANLQGGSIVNDGQPIITRINVPESRLSNNSFLNIVYLLFGGSFLGFLLFLIAALFRHPISDILLLIGATVFAVAMGPRRHPIMIAIAWYLGSFVALIVVLTILWSLANLASNGVFSSDKSGATQFYTEIYLAVGVLWLLFGVPHRAFKYQIDPHGEGKAQKTILGLLVVVASILTGTLFILLHFGDGPLRKVDIRALLVGTIFTVFLLAPGYKSVARACWKRGITRIIPLKMFARHWSKAAEEVRTALRQRRVERRAQNPARAKGTGDSRNSHEYSAVQTSNDNRASPPRNNPSQPRNKVQETGDAPRNLSSQRPNSGRGASPTRRNRKRRRKHHRA
jgi:hypothetical protein